MRNAGVEESQAGIKIAGRNINNLIYMDDTTLMAESKEELKSLLMRLKEENKTAGLKPNINKQTYKQLRSWHPVPSLHGKYKRKVWEQKKQIFQILPGLELPGGIYLYTMDYCLATKRMK